MGCRFASRLLAAALLAGGTLTLLETLGEARLGQLMLHEPSLPQPLACNESAPIYSMSLAPQAGTVLLRRNGDRIERRNWRTGRPTGPLPIENEQVLVAAQSADGRVLAAGYVTGGLVFSGAAVPENVRVKPADCRATMSLVLSDDGAFAVSGHEDGCLCAWQTATGRRLWRLAGHAAAVRDLRLSPDGQSLASLASDGSIRLWNLEDGRLVRALDGCTTLTMAVAFAAEGRELAAASHDGRIRRWHIATGRELGRWTAPSPQVASLAISPDGRTAAAGADGRIFLWDMASGREIAELRAHRAAVRCVAFSPDGRYLFSGSYDGTFRVWDATMHNELRCLR